MAKLAIYPKLFYVYRHINIFALLNYTSYVLERIGSRRALAVVVADNDAFDSGKYPKFACTFATGGFPDLPSLIDNYRHDPQAPTAITPLR